MFKIASFHQGGIVDEFGSETSTSEILFFDADGSLPSSWQIGPELPFMITGATIIPDGEDLVLVSSKSG